MIYDIFMIGAQIGLLYGPLALGIYLAMNILSLPDLTLEGSFGLGGAATAASIVAGINPIIAFFIGMAVGSGAGMITALLHVLLQMNVLLAGILMTTAAWSVSLAIMGTGNVALMDHPTLFSWAESIGLGNQMSLVVVGALVTLVFAVVLVLYLQTGFGLAARATGLNIQTARSLGIKTELHQVVGLMIANALAAASGALVAQSQGFMDVSIQSGVIVVGLAALVIGTSIVRTNNLIVSVGSVILGVVVYRCLVALSLRIGISPNYVRLLTAVLVFVVVAMRIHGDGLLSGLSSEGRKRRKRKRVQFLENDRVANLF